MLPLLFSMLLPLAAFVGGGYLVYRGFSRMSPPPGLSGTAHIQHPIPSHATKRPCAYSKTVVEYYTGSHEPWKRIVSLEKRIPFQIDGKSVDAEHADFRLSKPAWSRGYVQPKGLLGELRHNVRQVSDMLNFLSDAVAPNEMVDAEMLESVMEDEGAMKKIKPFLGKALRISEYIVGEGMRLSVAPDPAVPQGPGSIKGTGLYPLIITDSCDGEASSSMREKAYVSIFIGAALILASFVLFGFLLLSALSP